MTSALRVIVVCASAALAVLPRSSQAQNKGNGAGPRPGEDSVVVKAGPKYGASGFHRFWLGDNYRDLWAQPITVPVLDLGKYAGGLTALEEGGNAQTRNLHLRGADGKEYVFRPVFKELVQMHGVLEGTVVADLINDGLSASHPAATMLPTPFLEVAGVIHASPELFVMPDDPRLGEFRKNFAGKLGTMEEFPEDPKDAPGFAGAVDIIDSEHLLERLNKDPSNQVDAHALLTARLVDLLIGDNDRHPGQWKWARLQSGSNAPWVPIPRDRDKAFVSYEGALLKAARLALPRLVTYRTVPQHASFYNAVDFDRRLLVSLSKADFDSTARFLARVVTDSVIDAAMRSMPKEYLAVQSDLASRIRGRRASLPAAAAAYYQSLFTIVDLHASDAPDRATVQRQSDGSVDIRLASSGITYLDRRFSAGATTEIRLYLHDGSDTAVVTGTAASSIPLWIVGGSGRNDLIDSSTVGGRQHPTRMYDNGGMPDATVVAKTGDVAIANTPEREGGKKADSPAREDSDGRKSEDDEKKDNEKKDNENKDKKNGGYDPDTAWNRRPVMKLQGYDVPPFRDQGSSIRPTLSISTGRGLGVMPTLRITRRKFGFRQFPYASKTELKVGYATAVQGWEAGFTTDNRIESSRMFIATETGLTQVQTGNFGGLGNDVERPEDRRLTQVKQNQMYFQPSVGWAFGLATEFTMGPVVKFTTTDSLTDRFVSQSRPYGFSRFGQAGFAVRLLHESTRQVVAHGGTADELLKEDPKRGLTVDASAAVYPAVWDAKSTFGTVSAVATTFVTLPLPLSPVFALRAGGQQNFGQAPYFESAFLGGRHSVRTLRRQDYAGDAMLYGSAEFRIPLARFAFILPLNTGIFGFADAGRVYVDGESPGGWHTGFGGGLWLGVLKRSTNVSIAWTDQRDRRVIVGTGFIF